MNKKGQMTIFMVILGVACLFVVIFLLTGGLVVIKINDALSQDINLGQINLKNVTEDTWGVWATTYQNNADFWGLSAIFGMVMGLFLSAYLLRNRFPKWGIILDIFIIVAMFMVALYISSTYSILLDGLNSAGEPFLEEFTPKTSFFVINLHIFTVIIGVIMMVLFHSAIPRRTEERLQEGGFLQGVQ